MISVDKYIRNLLYEQNCVIIPGFGGLITHHVHSQYNADRKQYAPSRKKIAFNEVLKQDDGLLVHTIRRQERIDQNLAVELVRQYVKTLSAKISLEGRGEVVGVGNFSQNGEGSLVFEPLNTVSFDTDWFGFTEIAVQKLGAKKEIAEPVEVVSTNYVANTNYAASTNYIEENPEEMMVLGEPKRRSWMKWTAAAVAAGVITYFSTIYGTVDTSSMLSSLNPLSGLLDSMEPAREKLIEEVSEDKKEGDYDLADSLIREINGMSHPGTEEAVAVSTDSIDTTAPLVEPIVEVKPAVKAEVVAAPVVAEVKKEIQPVASKKFHLVAGSFSTERTAAKLVDELKGKGYSDAIYLEHKGKELVKVSAKSYASMSEAYKGRADLEKVVGAGVWVFRDK